MIRTKVLRHLAIVLSASFALACADSPTSPSAPTAPAPSAISAPTAANEGLISGVLGIVRSLTRVVTAIIDPDGVPSIQVKPVEWAASHTRQVRSVSGTIGPWGGSLAIPGSDFTIIFPAGALSVNTNITIVSDDSRFVSYDMQPHGLQFAKPVVVTQRLRNTKAYGVPLAANAKLFGAYFPQENPLLELVGDLLNALEIVHSVTILRHDGSPELQTWLLNHFSRYMLASG